MTLPGYSAVCVCIFSFPAACRKVTRLRGHAQAMALRSRPFVVCGLVTAPARVPSPHPREPRRFGSQGRPLPIAQGPGRTAFHAGCRPPPRRSRPHPRSPPLVLAAHGSRLRARGSACRRRQVLSPRLPLRGLGLLQATPRFIAVSLEPGRVSAFLHFAVRV